MKRPSAKRPNGNPERLLNWVVSLFLLVYLVLVIPIQASYIQLDPVHSSLPTSPLNILRLANLPIIRDLSIESLSRTSTHTSRQNPIFTVPSHISKGKLVNDSFNSSMQFPPLVQSRSSLIDLSTAMPTSEGQYRVLFFPLIFNNYSISYYVDPYGNDSAPGTRNQPWRTIQKAADTMTAGETTIILAGEYAERVSITQSGAPDAPITFKTEGTVTMKGFTVRADHIVIHGFDITDTDNNWIDGWGIFVQGSHCVLENNYVYFATRGGIMLYADSGDDSITSNCVVKNNRLYHNAHTGIYVQGRNNLIVGNEIWRTIQHHPKWQPLPSWADADGIRFFGSGHAIRKNYIHDISYDDPENVNPHIDCFQTWGSGAGYDVIFEQNICEVLENQAVHENGHGFMLEDARNIIIRNNIIQAYGGINTGGGGNSHLTIVNNIFVNDLSFQPYPGGVGLSDSPYTVVKNNILYNQPYHTISVTGDTSGQEIDYNLAYRSDGQPSECYVIDYECVDPAPIHHLWDIDPLFINPESGVYHLRQDSPAIDAGITLAEVINDFDGISRPQGAGYDIGVYEYTE